MNSIQKRNREQVNTKGMVTENDISVISLAWDLGWMIVVPIVVFATGGAFIDKSIGTSPWMLLGGIGLSLIITSVMVYRKTIDAMSILSNVDDKKKK
jgi:F0F1-type ATP synthase assembly protein I